KFPLHPQMRLLHHRILQVVVDYVYPARSRPGQDKARERVRQCRGTRQEVSVLVQKYRGAVRCRQRVPCPDVYRQSAAIQPAFERDELKTNPNVIDPISAADNESVTPRSPCKTHSRSEIVIVRRTVAAIKSRDQRIDLIVAR